MSDSTLIMLITSCFYLAVILITTSFLLCKIRLKVDKFIMTILVFYNLGFARNYFHLKCSEGGNMGDYIQRSLLL